MDEPEQTQLSPVVYLLLLAAITLGPMLVTGALVLMIDGRVPDFSDVRDVLQFAIAIGFGLIIWGIGFVAYWRRGARAANRKVAVVAKIQPAFWLLGAALGAAAGVGIIDSAMANRANLAESYCMRLLSPEDAQWAPCLEVALQCDDETDEGPCGDIRSVAQADACTAAYKQRLAGLDEDARTVIPEPVGGDHGSALRAICIVEKVGTE